MKIKWRLIVAILGIGFLFIAIGLFGSASYYQQEVAEGKELISHTEWHTMGFRPIVEFIEHTEATTIAALATAGTIFFLAASVCLLTSTRLLG